VKGEIGTGTLCSEAKKNGSEGIADMSMKQERYIDPKKET
jgi:hypothetical protein